MYEPGHDKQQLAAFGFRPEDYAETYIEVWQENATVVDLFSRLQTQWRTGFSGPTGLDYAAVWALLNNMDAEDKFALFDDVQVMEFAALAQMSDNREGQERKK